MSREKRNLTENKKTLTPESETTNTLNLFSLNIVKKLETPKFDARDSVTDNIKDLVFKAILKKKNHPSAYNSKMQQAQNISFQSNQHCGNRN